MAYPTNDTYSSLIDEVITSLQGYGVDNDAVCTLTSSMDEAETVFTVDDSDVIGTGLIEIDEEIMYVSSADQGTVNIYPWGRGYKGTVAAAHNAFSLLSVSPTWPRAVVAREVNNVIRAVYPDLYAVNTFDVTASPTQWQYSLPADVDRVLSVEWRWQTSVDGWMPIHGWEMVYSANVTDFGTGKMLAINEPLPTGTRIHITYAAPPSLLTDPGDLFTSTGLDPSCRDVIVYGAAYRLLPWQDTGRIPVETVSSDVQDSLKPVGNAISLSKELRNMYQLALLNAVRTLQDHYPSRAHRIR